VDNQVVDNALLTEAVVVWTGRGERSFPDRDDDRVIERFGPERGLDLVPEIHRLAHDFYESDARFTVRGLVQMGEKAAADFRARYPQIGEAAVQALMWCYTFDYK
jgi:hypothetical protein